MNEHAKWGIGKTAGLILGFFIVALIIRPFLAPIARALYFSDLRLIIFGIVLIGAALWILKLTSDKIKQMLKKD